MTEAIIPVRKLLPEPGTAAAETSAYESSQFVNGLKQRFIHV
jgi:hypothetical protein